MNRRSHVLFTLTALGTLWVLPAATAQTAQQQPPPPGPERPFAFPSHTTTKLENGLTLFVVEDHRQPLVNVTLMIPGAGSSGHPASQAGLAAMTASLLRQGTEKRSAQQIADAIDRVGGSLAASAGADATTASVTVLTSALDTGFELMADILQRPAFSQEEIDRWRRQALSSLQVSYTDPEYLRSVVGQRIGYGEHPYAQPSDGAPNTVRDLSREDIVAFYRSHYTPAGAYMAVTGAITPDAAAGLVRKHFGGWKGSAPPVRKLPAPQPERRVVIVDMPDAVQTQFGLVGPGVPRNHPDWLALAVANQVVGAGFNSRLNMRLRAQEGLTYGAGSGFDSRLHAGLWNASSFTRTEETGRAIKVSLDVIREFRKNPATPAELSEATSFLSGVFALQTETASGVADRVLTSALHGLPPDYWQTYRERVRAVSAADISRVVERHIDPDRLSIVAVGNAKGFSDSLKELGEVRIVPAARLDLSQPGLMVAAEAAAGPEAAARGRELIEAAVKAAGGAELIGGVKDAVSTGAVTLVTPGGDMEGQASSTVLHPDKVRVVITLPVGEIVQAFDGSSAWARMGPQPATDLPPAMHDEMRRSILLSGGIGVLREAIQGRAEVAALEPKPVEGATLDRVSWKQGEIEMVLGLDPKTHHIVHVSYRGMTPQGPADGELRLSDYKPAANGLVVPMRTATYQNGQKAAELVVTEWRFNTGVTEEIFRKQ